MQKTLTILKPDTVASGNAGKIIARLEAEGFRFLGAKLVRLTPEIAGQFYAVHRERPFYKSLVEFMSEGPVMPIALERDDAILHLRAVMGATDPAEAAAGTIRKLYGESKGRNAIHGSDSEETARFEIGFFFAGAELIGSDAG